MKAILSVGWKLVIRKKGKHRKIRFYGIVNPTGIKSTRFHWKTSDILLRSLHKYDDVAGLVEFLETSGDHTTMRHITS